MTHVGIPWVVVLAGGSGERLRLVTTSASGESIPKQFCRLGGRNSMLGITLARAQRFATIDRILVLVREEHRIWWQTDLASIRQEQVLVQSRNRGTGIALLSALLHLHDRDPDACVVVLPSDHLVDDENLIGRAVLEAIDEARLNAEHVVVVGAHATMADTSLGWIIPDRSKTSRIQQVAGFVEKPSSKEAAECIRRGALRNTLILAGGVRAFLRLYAFELLAPAGIVDMPNDVLDSRIARLSAIHAELPGMDLSRDILQQSSQWLRVLPLPECGWTDIGTLERLEEWWKSHPGSFAEVRRFGVFPAGPQAGATPRSETNLVDEELVAATGTDGPARRWDSMTL